MASSSVPKHGDKIIVENPSALGEPKMVATPQFQRFLDEIGSLLDATGFDFRDAEQLFAVNDGRISALKTSFQNINKKFLEITSENTQLIAKQETEIQTLRANSRRMESMINDIEQLAHVN